MSHQVCGVHDKVGRGALAMQLDAALIRRGRSVAGDQRVTEDVRSIILLAELGVDRSDGDGTSKAFIERSTILDLDSLRFFGDFCRFYDKTIDEIAGTIARGIKKLCVGKD